jgi:hypothetical protein
MFTTDTMSIDASKPSKDGMSIQELESYLDDMRAQPAWRQRADLECNYYDGNQHSPEDIQKAQERNLPVVTTNLIAPTVNMILGMEARTRTDWVVKSDGSSSGLTVKQADGLTAELNEAERNTYADQACADGYESQVKAGIGWVEVSKVDNPFEYPLRVCAVDRREIWWDMRAKDRLLRDARWLVRRKWHDLDAVLTMVPGEQRQYVEAAVNNPAGWDYQSFAAAFPMLQDGLIARDWFSDSAEWCDTVRKRVCAYEVWYRVWKSGLVMIDPEGRAEEYDKKNPKHLALVGQGMVQLKWARYQKMRLSWWVGPFRLSDVPSPYGHNEFPYVPFWGYMEDDTRTPYGVIRSMKSLQDEVNARRSRMMWQLSAQRVIAEGDAVTDHKAAADEVNRPDAYIKLNPGRRQRGSQPPFKIEDHSGMNAQQYEIYQDAKQSLQQSGGVYAAMLGDPKAGADSGVAIDSLIEQGTTVLAKINSNYKLARTEVGRKLLYLVLQQLGNKEKTVTLLPNAPSGAKSVTLNQRVIDPETGEVSIRNDVTRMMWKVALGDVSQNATHQQERLKQLTEFAKSLPPELQVIFADLVVMASDLPNREQIAARIRQQTGQQPMVDPETATPEELAEAEAAMEAARKQQEINDLATQIELEQGAAKAELDRSKSAMIKGQTELQFAKVGLTRAQAIEALLGLGQAPAKPAAAAPAGGKKPTSGGAKKPAPAAAPQPKPPSEAEMMEAGRKGAMLEEPRHDDRLSLGAGMDTF